MPPRSLNNLPRDHLPLRRDDAGVESGQVQFGPYLLVLHGGALVLGLLWLAKRNNNWTLRRRARPAPPEGQAA